MGGDDSQKLLPRRGSYSPPGRKPPAQLRNNTVTENCGWVLAGHNFAQPAGSWLSYRLLGSFLESRPGSFLPSAEASWVGSELSAVAHPRSPARGCIGGPAPVQPRLETA